MIEKDLPCLRLSGSANDHITAQVNGSGLSRYEATYGGIQTIVTAIKLAVLHDLGEEAFSRNLEKEEIVRVLENNPDVLALDYHQNLDRQIRWQILQSDASKSRSKV